MHSIRFRNLKTRLHLLDLSRSHLAFTSLHFPFRFRCTLPQDLSSLINNSDTMARTSVLRFAQTAARPATTVPRASALSSRTRFLSTTAARTISSGSIRRDASDPYHKQSTAATGTSAGPHEGSASRTDNQISFEYPEDENMEREKIVQGRGGKSPGQHALRGPSSCTTASPT